MDTQLSLSDTEVAFRYQDDYDLKRAYWLFKALSSGFLTMMAQPSIKLALRLGLPIKPLIRHTIFKQFCGGENIDACQASITRLARFNVSTILDYSVESGNTEEAYDCTCNEMLQVIARASHDPHVPFAVIKLTGLGRFELLEKAAADGIMNVREAEEYQRIIARVNQICHRSYIENVRLLIDAEHSWIQPLVDRLAWQCALDYNRTQPIVYNTYQLYRHDKLDALRNDYLRARQKGVFLGAKLVRGAYMELERRRAEKRGYRSLIHMDKDSVDQDYDAGVAFCLENIDRVALVVGTHNDISTLKATECMKALGVPANHSYVYFSQLLGMSDHLSFNLAKAGYQVAKYMPYGPIEAVMPYLFRRAEENSSVAGQSGREFLLLRQELERRKKTARTRS